MPIQLSQITQQDNASFSDTKPKIQNIYFRKYWSIHFHLNVANVIVLTVFNLPLIILSYTKNTTRSLSKVPVTSDDQRLPLVA